MRSWLVWVKCEVCGKKTRGYDGKCTNDRCHECHVKYCTPGGNTTQGHGRRWPTGTGPR